MDPTSGARSPPAASPAAGAGSSASTAHDAHDSFSDSTQDNAYAESEHESELSPTIPPYWRHYRQISNGSIDSTLRGANPITLQDNETSPTEGRGPLWARSVAVDDYAIVQGRTGIGAYVVWNCRVQTLDGGPMTIRKRYSEFDELREKLQQSFPKSKGPHSIPELPPKSALYKFRPKFLEKRRKGLEYFLNCVLLNPEFAGSPVLKEFLFSHDN